jgi:RES domain-containing protein
MVTADWRDAPRQANPPLCQVVGQTAFELGVEGLLVPSAADPEGVNLVVFPLNLSPRSRMEIINSSRLQERKQ